MITFDEINNFVYSIDLGEYYPIIYAFSIFALTTFLLAFSILVKKFTLNYTLILPAIFFPSFIILCVKFLADGLYGKISYLNQLPISLFIIFLSSLEYFAITLIKTSKKDISNKEKRLIEGFLENNQLKESIISDNVFSENPFKRVEFLNTGKIFLQKGFDDFNINPAYIEKQILELKEKDLSLKDEMQLQEIDFSFQKYKLKNLTDFERNDFSTKLQILLKMSTKYADAKIDLFQQ